MDVSIVKTTAGLTQIAGVQMCINTWLLLMQFEHMGMCPCFRDLVAKMPDVSVRARGEA